ncbi:3-deoxy-D-manno-octulosonic-acid transferase [Amorphus suaedae]
MPSWTGMRADAILYTIWRGVSRAARPFLQVLLALRVRRGKEDPERLAERRGRPSLPRPEGDLVWIHCASVGETNAVLPLIERLVARDLNVLLTTTTVTASRVAASRLPAGAVHQFAALDVVTYLHRFLRHWRPTLALFVESELWPIALDELARAGIPRIVVNGRMSKRSARGWSRFPLVHRAIFGRITEVFAQSPADADRFRALGVGKVRDVGNMKYDGDALAADPEALEGLRAALGERPRWLAASTHPGEEDLVAAAHARLAGRWPGLVTLLVPRHPNRGTELRDSLAAAGHAVALRSAGDPLPEAGGIYIADTIGELGLFFRTAAVVLMGGSLVEKGGQNPIEPGRLGCAVVVGPHTENFAAVYQTLLAAGGAVSVADVDGLIATVDRLLADPEEAATIAEAGAQVALAQGGAVERTMTALDDYLGGPDATPAGVVPSGSPVGAGPVR